MRLLLICGAALTVTSASSYSKPRTTEVEAVAGPSAADRAPSTQDVRFRTDAYDRMTVAVTVAGKGPYRFLVDTGADRTAVSTAMASQLNLAEGPSAVLHSVTGPTVVRTAEVPSLQLSSRKIRSVRAPLLDSGNMGADGILGVDSLRSERVLFDFKSRSISIVPSRAREKDEQDSIVVYGRLRRGHLIVTSAKANRQTVTVVLDTGAELTVGNEALRRSLQARGRLGAATPVEVVSVTGQKLTGDCIFLKELEVGGIVLNDVGVLFADAKTFRTLDLETKPTLLLGMNALRAFDKVSIDFANRKFRVVVPQRSDTGSVLLAAR